MDKHNTVLSLKNIRLTYHSKDIETVALDNISFNLHEGDFMGIVGPSGCGKTTVLSIVAGLMKPSGGEIKFADNVKTGYMLQKDQLFEWRNIYKNIILGLEINKQMTSENLKYADELLLKYGLSEFKNRRPSELSGGMRQRAALIRTLVLKPDILLLDEPFSALDFQTRLMVCDDVHSIIKSEGKTALFVTHDISEAISTCDKIAVLSPRPATIKGIYDVEMNRSLSPLRRREDKNFSYMFEKIWKELEIKDELQKTT